MASSRPVPVPVPDKPSPVVVKKYANRRLYNTESSSYITLDHLAQLTRDGREFQVLDARTGEDITRAVLTQIIMEQENGGQTMLPVPFLRQLIAMYGDNMQSMVPHYLEASMDALKRNQAQMRDTIAGAFSGTPFEAIAKQNLTMFEKAAEMWAPKLPAVPVAAVAEPAGDELARLKAEMSTLQAKLDKLGG